MDYLSPGRMTQQQYMKEHIVQRILQRAKHKY